MLKEILPKSSRRQAVFKDWGTALLEIGKWLLVVWLLWPLGRPGTGGFVVVRIVLGVCLLVLFAGKVFYDVILMDIIRQKRPTLKRDIFTLIAVVTVIALLVGLVLALIGLFITRWAGSTHALPAQ